MSKIKSDNSDITIDASGSGRNIKFQANGVEKASISSAGAFTSTTIDATKLTGDLPAISGANLTGLPQSFTGAVTATTDMVVQATGSSRKMFMGVSSDDLAIGNYSNSNATRNEHLKITSDGRGLSAFTIFASAQLGDLSTTPAIENSHNISSVTDVSTGRYKCNFTNNTGGNRPQYTVSGQNRTRYDEIYYANIDASSSSAMQGGCTLSGASAGWHDTHKMNFIAVETPS